MQAMRSLSMKAALWAGMISLGIASTASAQKFQPFGPIEVEKYHDLQLFAPADLGDFGRYPDPNYGFFGSYERVFWHFTNPTNTQVGDPSQAGFYNVDGQIVYQENSVSNGWMTASAGWGNRFDLGYMESNDHGWLVSVTTDVGVGQSATFDNALILFADSPNDFFSPVFIDRNNDGIWDDINGNNVFGPDGIDLGTPEEVTEGDPPVTTTIYNLPFDGIPDEPFPTDFDDAINILARFDNLTTTNNTSMNQVELNHMWRCNRDYFGGILEIYAGARYMQINDDFLISATGGLIANTFCDTQVKNNMIGPQIGGRYTHQRDRWVMSVEGRFFAAMNLQNFKQYSETASEFPEIVNGGNVPSINDQGLYATSAFASDYHEAYSACGELRLNTSYKLSKAVALKLGYTMNYMDNIARASNRVDYSLPFWGIKKGEDENLWVSGVNFGVELNR